MLNLLRFEGDAGAESYARYAEAVAPLLAAVGGEIVWSGACHPALIAPEGEEWDAVALVRYPSRERFLEMISTERYREIQHLRADGLSDSRLIPCSGS
jgi:uncharacterized protein (DUF1330 family)